MELAKCRVRQDQFGSDVPKSNVTPAEVVILRTIYKGLAGCDPISDVVVTGEFESTVKREAMRLRQRYGRIKVKTGAGAVAVVDHLFPGREPALPMKFADIGEEEEEAPVDTANTDIITSAMSDFGSKDELVSK